MFLVFGGGEGFFFLLFFFNKEIHQYHSHKWLSQQKASILLAINKEVLKKGWGEKDIFWAVNYLFFLCNFTCLFICTDRFLAFTIAVFLYHVEKL